MKNPNFPSVPNQRYITTHKPTTKAGEFTYINLLNTKDAMRTLSASAFKLYIFFSLNADKYEFWLWRQLCCEVTGLSKNTYYKAFNELRESGYLVSNTAENETFFTFYDTAKTKRPVPKNGTPSTKNEDNLSQNEVEKTNNNIENKRELALLPKASGNALQNNPFLDI